MSLKKAIFGVEDPSRVRRIAVAISLPAVAFSAYGFWVDFVPSPVIERLGFFSSLIVGAAVTVVLFKRLGSEVLGSAGKSKLVKWFFVIVTPAVSVYFSLAALGHGVPAIYTALAGTAFSENVQLVKNWSGGRRTCNFRLEGGPVEKALPGYICISEPVFESLPNGRLNLRLFGRKSVVGVLYERFERT